MSSELCDNLKFLALGCGNITYEKVSRIVFEICNRILDIICLQDLIVQLQKVMGFLGLDSFLHHNSGLLKVHQKNSKITSNIFISKIIEFCQKRAVLCKIFNV